MMVPRAESALEVWNFSSLLPDFTWYVRPSFKVWFVNYEEGHPKKGPFHSKYIFHPWTKISSSQTFQSCADTKPKDSYPNGFLALPEDLPFDFATSHQPPRCQTHFAFFTAGPCYLSRVSHYHQCPWWPWVEHVGWISPKKTHGLNRAIFLQSQIHRKKASEKHLSVKTLPPLQQQKEWVYRKFPDKTKHVMIQVTQHEVTRSFSTSCRIIESFLTQIICILQNITQKHWHTSRRKLKPFLKGSWVRGEWFLWWLAPHCFGRLGTKM